MSLTGVTFSNQKVTPSDDGRLYSSMLSDGILTGCSITFTAATLSIAAGSLLIGGRELRTSGETLSVTGATSGYARVLIDIDLTKAATKDSFEQAQWLIQYAASTDAFAALETQDINSAGTHFQAIFCVLSLGSAGIASVLSSMGSASASLSDGSVSLAKLANDARFGIDTGPSGTSATIVNAWGNALVFVWQDGVTITLDAAAVATLPANWQCRLFAGNAFTFAWSGLDGVRSTGEGISKENAGSIAVPANRFIDLRRSGTGQWIFFGNYADRHITAGTADPTGGNDGDIYIQYSE